MADSGIPVPAPVVILPNMGRIPRPNLPGCAFHLTTRLQDRAHRFTGPVRDRVVQILASAVERSDAALLAFVVMTNHLHLVVVQGAQPLSSLMQPFLRSVALAVHRAHGTAGHVVERRYRDVACHDAAHLRNAIAYTHANPVTAGLCERVEDYRWSSHGLYAGTGLSPFLRLPRVDVDIAVGLQAFSPPDDDTATRRSSLRDAYGDFLERVLTKTAGQGGPGTSAVDVSSTTAERRAAAARGTAFGREPLERIAKRILAARSLPSSLLQSRWRGRQVQEIRAELAVAGVREGFTGREVAGFLQVSESTVSRLLSRAVRRSGPPA